VEIVMKLILLVVLLLAACGTTFKVEPVKVEPIHMTIDVVLHDDAPKSADKQPTK
jgi:hypothetical protein